MKAVTYCLVYFICLVQGFRTVDAQECTSYLPGKVGTKIFESSYNPKGKLTGKVVQEITGYKESPGTTYTIVKTTTFDDKNEKVGTTEFEAECKDGMFRIDLSNAIDLEGFKKYNLEMEIEAENLSIPANLRVGQELEEATMNIKFSSSGFEMPEAIVTIKERKVEAFESVMTPAGTFPNCAKITQVVEVNWIVNMTSKSESWYYPGIGAVKTMNYKKNGKLEGYSQIEKIEE